MTTAMRMPGISPPAKSWPMETLPTTPKMTMGNDGGMIGPMVEDAAVMPTANSSL